MPELHNNASSSAQFDVSRFDRTPGFTVRERKRIAAVAAGESLHLCLGDPLAPLLEPLKAGLRLTEAQQSQHSMLRHLVVEMHETGTVSGPGKRRVGPVCTVAVRGRRRRPTHCSMCCPWQPCSVRSVCPGSAPGPPYPSAPFAGDQDLRSRSGGPLDRQGEGRAECLGYTGYFYLEVQNALRELFLVNRTPSLRLEAGDLHAVPCLGRACHPINSLDPRRLVQAKMMLGLHKRRSGVAVVVHALIRNIDVAAKHEAECALSAPRCGPLVEIEASGGVEAGPVDSPACRRIRGCHRSSAIGELIDDRQRSYPDRLLNVSSRLSHLSALRCFLTDLSLWELVPRRSGSIARKICHCDRPWRQK